MRSQRSIISDSHSKKWISWIAPSKYIKKCLQKSLTTHQFILVFLLFTYHLAILKMDYPNMNGAGKHTIKILTKRIFLSGRGKILQDAPFLSAQSKDSETPFSLCDILNCSKRKTLV